MFAREIRVRRLLYILEYKYDLQYAINGIAMVWNENAKKRNFRQEQIMIVTMTDASHSFVNGRLGEKWMSELNDDSNCICLSLTSKVMWAQKKMY